VAVSNKRTVAPLNRVTRNKDGPIVDTSSGLQPQSVQEDVPFWRSIVKRAPERSAIMIDRLPAETARPIGCSLARLCEAGYSTESGPRPPASATERMPEEEATATS
jgi:hypothetical protein